MNASKNPHYGCRQKAEDRAGELNSALSSTQKAYQKRDQRPQEENQRTEGENRCAQ